MIAFHYQFWKHVENVMYTCHYETELKQPEPLTHDKCLAGWQTVCRQPKDVGDAACTSWEIQLDQPILSLSLPDTAFKMTLPSFNLPLRKLTQCSDVNCTFYCIEKILSSKIEKILSSKIEKILSSKIEKILSSIIEKILSSIIEKNLSSIIEILLMCLSQIIVQIHNINGKHWFAVTAALLREKNFNSILITSCIVNVEVV